ncbi:MAG: DUF3473 domain-containing protein [Acidobacteria bacterium]|nr:DUF3473 domain-containing protein [Acidobacteriota bacterium]
MIHGLSIDVEDWYQSTIDPDAPLTGRFEASTDSILACLAEHGIKATFFVLGLAAEKLPHLVKRIAAAGHELQSHGYGHRNNFELSRDELRADLARAKALLEDLSGQEIYGYRAPCFSIDERNLWALDVLAETGHRYDSSIFPLKTGRYGIEGYRPEPRLVDTPGGGRIVEAPVASFTLWTKRLPVGGGGYFRLWPYPVIRHAWRQMQRLGRPGLVYMHPYEYDPTEMADYHDSVPLMRRIHQGLGRKSFPKKIDRLLDDFEFGPLKDALAGPLSELSEA